MNQVDLNLKKYEIEPNWVTFYFDEVSSNTHPMSVTHLLELYASCCCINSSFLVFYHCVPVFSKSAALTIACCKIDIFTFMFQH